MAILDRVAAVRQPEYTGQNRCLPCTILNLGMVSIISLLAGWAVAAVGYGTGWAVVSGGSLFVVAGVIIYLRGYLIPGTPWLTDRYLPGRVRKALGKQVSGASISDIDAELAQPLLAAGIISPGRGAEEPAVTDEFRTALDDRSESVKADDGAGQTFARLIGVDPDDLWLRSYGGTFKILWNGKAAGQWESEKAFHEDMAAASLLEEGIDGWQDTPPRERAAILAGLRCLTESCSDCDSDPMIAMDTCCGSTDIVRLECDACEAVLLEIRSVD